MITFVKNTDIFTLDTKAIVNPVNCVGAMGKGLALQFKKRYPNNYITYKHACNTNELRIGTVLAEESNNKIIINFPTKDHWKDPSKLEYIRLGLIALKSYLATNNIPSIAIGAIGCGLGGLDWNIVKPMIVKELQDLDTEIIICEPY